jgi:CBS domain-containing protein
MLAVAEIMRHEIAVVSPDVPVRRVVEAMVEASVDGVLVIDGRGRVIGSVGDEQLVARLNASRDRPWWHRPMDEDRESTDPRLSTLPAGEVMLRRVVTVDPALSVTSAARLFDEHAVTVMPVVDRGRLVGALFRRDLVSRLLLGAGGPQPLGET